MDNSRNSAPRQETPSQTSTNKPQRSTANEPVRASRISNEIYFRPKAVNDPTFQKAEIDYIDHRGIQSTIAISEQELRASQLKIPYPPLDRLNPHINARLVYQHKELRCCVKCKNWALHLEEISHQTLKGWIGAEGEMQIVRPFRVFQGQRELSYYTEILPPRDDATSALVKYNLKCFSITIRLGHTLSLAPSQIRLSYHESESFFSELEINHLSWQEILARSLDAAPPMTRKDAGKLTNRQTKQDTKIAILMPIYNGIPETVNALNSLRQYFQPKAGLRIRLLLGLDNPSNHSMTSAIQNSFGRFSNIQIIVNPVNLGFIGNCNNMFSLVEADEEVLLLNSDIIAPSSNWIERLLECGKQDNSIGTITPLSNQASIFSFPLANQDHQGLPLGLKIDEVDFILHENFLHHSTPCYEEVPSCHGFCTLIFNSRLRLDHLFDTIFGKGYAEENDLSMVVNSRGLKNVCHPGVYVYHHESVSFSHDKTELIKANLKLLGDRYKTYHKAVRQYCLNDPLRLFRTKAILDMLKYQSQKMSKSYTLHICHERGGGTHSFIDTYCKNHPGDNHLLLTPDKSGIDCLKLGIVNTAEEYFSVNHIADFYENELFDEASGLQDLGITRAVMHSMIDFPTFGAIDLYTKLLESLPSIAYIHDYHWICLNENLLVKKNHYIGPHGCDLIHDLSLLSSQKRRTLLFAISNSNHVRRMERILYAAKTIIAPSHCAADLVQARTKVARQKIKVLYHDTSTEFASFQERSASLSHRNTPVNIAVIGAIGPNKGYDSLVQLVRHNEACGAMLRIVFIGYTCNDKALERSKHVTITGKYDERDFPRLVKEYSIDCSLFLSPWPETYSYTLSLAFREKIWPFVYNIGAPAERVKNSGFGSILENTDSSYIYCKITSFFNCRNMNSSVIENHN